MMTLLADSRICVLAFRDSAFPHGQIKIYLREICSSILFHLSMALAYS